MVRLFWDQSTDFVGPSRELEVERISADVQVSPDTPQKYQTLDAVHSILNYILSSVLGLAVTSGDLVGPDEAVILI